MAGVFVRPALVVEPGIHQLGAAVLILIPTIGLTFSMQAHFSDRAKIDIPIRIGLAAISLFALLYTDETVAVLALLPVCLIIGYWLLRRRVAPPAESADVVAQPALASSFAGPSPAGPGN